MQSHSDLSKKILHFYTFSCLVYPLLKMKIYKSFFFNHFILVYRSQAIKHGTKITFIVSSLSSLGFLHHAEIQWAGSFSFYCTECNDVLFVKSLELTFQNFDQKMLVYYACMLNVFSFPFVCIATNQRE